MDGWTRPRASVEPFSLSIHFGVLQILKIIINALWLFPLRVLFIILPCVIVGFIVVFIIGCCFHQQEPPVPLKGWRKWLIVNMMPRLGRWFLFGFGYQWVEVIGELCSVEEVPVLIVSPHSTMLDPFLLGMITIPSVVTRGENRNIPLFGKAFEVLQTIFVHRGEQGSRSSTVNEICRRAKSKDEWPYVLLFPEGTTTNAKCVISYKRGAFIPGVPIQQVLFRHNNRHNTLIWAERGTNPILGLFLTICQFHNRLTIEFLPPYIPSAEEKADPLLYARNMQQRAAAHLGIPTTLHSYEDLRLLNMAERMGLPYATGIVEFDWLKSRTKFTFEEVRLLLERYCQMNHGRNNHLTAVEMANYLQLEPHPSSVLHERLQSETCKGSDGISFADYVLALGTMGKPLATNEQFTGLLYQKLDQSNRGYVTISDVQQPWMPSYFDDMSCDQFRQFLLDNLEYVVLADIILHQQNNS